MSRSAQEGGRRSSHVSMPVAYAAVGASRAPDLMRFPPEGSTPYEEVLRIGSGQERFLTASSVLMTWGAQRAAGFEVSGVERGDEAQYTGLTFDSGGRPEPAGEVEAHYGPDGEPYLAPGTSATLAEAGQEPRRVLVVYTLDEQRSVGFAWGTCDEAGAVGEQLFTVEHRDDDTVWAVARGFLFAPKSGLLGIKARSDIKSALEAVKRQIEALAPGKAGAVSQEAGGGSAGAEENASDDEGAGAAERGEAAAAAAGSAVPAEPVDPITSETAVIVDSDSEAEDIQGGTDTHVTHRRRPSRPRDE